METLHILSSMWRDRDRERQVMIQLLLLLIYNWFPDLRVGVVAQLVRPKSHLI